MALEPKKRNPKSEALGSVLECFGEQQRVAAHQLARETTPSGLIDLGTNSGFESTNGEHDPRQNHFRYVPESGPLSTPSYDSSQNSQTSINLAHTYLILDLGPRDLTLSS